LPSGGAARFSAPRRSAAIARCGDRQEAAVENREAAGAMFGFFAPEAT